MPKKETIQIQDHFCNLGTQLGFIAKKEHSFFHKKEYYSPIYDVIWFMDISKSLSSVKIGDLLGISNEWSRFFKLLPIAAFEIEGSTTSSKNQVGNFANLYLSPSLYNFAVVNNSGAGKENDTYRRGVRIARTFSTLYGTRNNIFCDFEHLNHTSVGTNAPLKIPNKNVLVSKGTGGESTSKNISLKLDSMFDKSKLNSYRDAHPKQFNWLYKRIENLQNINADNKNDFLLHKKAIWDPSTKETRNIKKANDFFYIPKPDHLYTVNLPTEFVNFLKELGARLDKEKIYYPILHYLHETKENHLEYPLLAIEIETSVSKHLNGGIMNMAATAFTGLLVAPEAARSHLKTLKEYLGTRNVFFKNIEDYD